MQLFEEERVKKAILPVLVLALIACTGCFSDNGNAPMAPETTTAESSFPVNKAMPGVETQFAASKPVTGDIVDTAIGAEFKTLVTAVQAAGLEDALRSAGPFTVFAPTDGAFEKLPEGLLAQLLLPENKDKLAALLKYHVISGAAVKSTDLRFFQKVETLNGQALKILRFFRLVVVNDTYVTMADVMASNGVIHVIDNVLIPEGFTLEEPVEPTLDIVDTAIAANFSTLVAAVQAAELEGALRGDGPLTVFAPTNGAFDKLPEGLVDELLLEENKDKLVNLLKYHVVLGEVRSTDLRRFQLVEMLQGERTLVRRSWRGGVSINNARVSTADVGATNGVIHIINKVLIPRSFYGYFKSLPQEAPAE